MHSPEGAHEGHRGSSPSVTQDPPPSGGGRVEGADWSAGELDAPTVTLKRTAGTSTGGRTHKLPFWVEIPALVGLAVLVAFVVQSFVVRMYVIPSGSMETTLHGCPGCIDDRVAIDELGYRFRRPSPGDVVVFKGPAAWAGDAEVSGQQSGNPVVRSVYAAFAYLSSSSPDEKDFVKRVIATGGQTVACCDTQNRVTVDGRPLVEPYLHFQSPGPATQAPFAPVRLGPDQLWVMGDNRNNSTDSRVHGPIQAGDVIGKAQIIILPVQRWGTVPDTDPQTTAPSR